MIESAQRLWRMVSASYLVALVRVGAAFTGGELAGRPWGKEARPGAA